MTNRTFYCTRKDHQNYILTQGDEEEEGTGYSELLSAPRPFAN